MLCIVLSNPYANSKKVFSILQMKKFTIRVRRDLPKVIQTVNGRTKDLKMDSFCYPMLKF